MHLYTVLSCKALIKMVLELLKIISKFLEFITREWREMRFETIMLKRFNHLSWKFGWHCNASASNKEDASFAFEINRELDFAKAFVQVSNFSKNEFETPANLPFQNEWSWKLTTVHGICKLCNDQYSSYWYQILHIQMCNGAFAETLMSFNKKMYGLNDGDTTAALMNSVNWNFFKKGVF